MYTIRDNLTIYELSIKVQNVTLFTYTCQTYLYFHKAILVAHLMSVKVRAKSIRPTILVSTNRQRKVVNEMLKDNQSRSGLLTAHTESERGVNFSL